MQEKLEQQPPLKVAQVAKTEVVEAAEVAAEVAEEASVTEAAEEAVAVEEEDQVADSVTRITGLHLPSSVDW